MDEKDRRENAARIARQLREPHTPLDAIFDRVVRPPRPSPWERPDVATFVAQDIPSPHGGTLQRQYLVDCPHGASDLVLQEPFPDDAVVLGNMMRTFWARTGCSCVPGGWAAA